MIKTRVLCTGVVFSKLVEPLSIKKKTDLTKQCGTGITWELIVLSFKSPQAPFLSFYISPPPTASNNPYKYVITQREWEGPPNPWQISLRPTTLSAPWNCFVSVCMRIKQIRQAHQFPNHHSIPYLSLHLLNNDRRFPSSSNDGRRRKSRRRDC
jgi:hypothetical protein